MFLLWKNIGFQQRDRQNSKDLNDDTFCRLPVTSCQANIRTENYSQSGILLNYDDDDKSQGYSRIKEAFRALTEENIKHSYISDNDFRSSNVRADDVGYNLYAFDRRHQQVFRASQPIQVGFIFDGVVPNKKNGYALVLKNKLVSVSSAAQ